MFRGRCPTRLDEKGRLKMPADFKHEIDRLYDGQFYITSFDGAVIKLYPLKEWEQFELTVKDGAGSYQQKQKFMDVTGYYGQQVELDNQGRLTIAERLRNKFKLEGEVDLLGKQDHIEIRLSEELSKSVESNPLSLEDMDVLVRPRN